MVLLDPLAHPVLRELPDPKGQRVTQETEDNLVQKEGMDSPDRRAHQA